MNSQVRIFDPSRPPIVLAHRAGGNEAPENSRAAFEKMADLGFTYIETDAHSTADGVVLLFHDPNLNRTTDASGKIGSMKWEEIQKIADLSGNPPVRLEEILDDFPQLVLNVDIKDWRVLDPIVRLVRRKECTDRLVLSSFSEKRLVLARARIPGVSTSLGVAAVARLAAASTMSRYARAAMLATVPGSKNGVQAAQVPEVYRGVRVITQNFIDTAHEHGLAVQVWTVNEATAMRRLLRMGVDGLITDQPSLARQVLSTELGEHS